jgi:GNAT superfamily N-acetyltransferase
MTFSENRFPLFRIMLQARRRALAPDRKETGSMLPFVQPLEPGSTWLTQIATEQFRHWGSRTGHDSQRSYQSFLERAAHSVALPRVLVATRRGILLGSVNLLVNEMTIRPQLTPWMGQLFVADAARCRGIGGGLVEAAIAYVGQLGYRELFLYTSGALPRYYRARGWIDVEDVDYLGKVRTIMRYVINPAP